MFPMDGARISRGVGCGQAMDGIGLRMNHLVGRRFIMVGGITMIIMAGYGLLMRHGALPG